MNVGKVGAPVQAVAPKKMTLADVRSGVISAPQRLLVYGTEGSGKSTFAAGAPKAIFLGAEGGTLYLDVARLPEPRTWQDVLDGLALVEHDAHVYETLVVDPLNWLEALCWHAVTGGKGAIDQKPFDYGAGLIGGAGKGGSTHHSCYVGNFLPPTCITQVRTDLIVACMHSA